MKIVVVEDNQTLQTSIKKVLADEGHFVEVFSDGESARKFCLTERDAIDLMIVDYMLPELDGVALIKAVREAELTTPIIMLTAKSTVEDKVTGLSGGADYYLTKPFAFEELFACMTALRRRPNIFQGDESLIQDGLVCNLIRRQVKKDGETIALTPTEFGILEQLILHKGNPVSQQALAEHVFDFAKENWSNTIEVHVKNLRKKLERNNYENPIKTIRGVGYTLTN